MHYIKKHEKLDDFFFRSLERCDRWYVQMYFIGDELKWVFGIHYTWKKQRHWYHQSRFQFQEVPTLQLKQIQSPKQVATKNLRFSYPVWSRVFHCRPCTLPHLNIHHAPSQWGILFRRSYCPKSTIVRNQLLKETKMASLPLPFGSDPLRSLSSLLLFFWPSPLFLNFTL